jgi:hypothetical protein
LLGAGTVTITADRWRQLISEHTMLPGFSLLARSRLAV